MKKYGVIVNFNVHKILKNDILKAHVIITKSMLSASTNDG
jgi:hypothetical protein